jgi:redox-sensitive bicupin YhaK (pirin superfamily)
MFACGEPLNEDVVLQESFVLNTTTKIIQAIRDYQMGIM